MKNGTSSWLGVVNKKMVLMSNILKIRAKEQAEAYLQQLRTIPRCEALRVMEQLLLELYRLRDVHTTERSYYEDNDNSCTNE